MTERHYINPIPFNEIEKLPVKLENVSKTDLDNLIYSITSTQNSDDESVYSGSNGLQLLKIKRHYDNLLFEKNEEERRKRFGQSLHSNTLLGASLADPCLNPYTSNPENMPLPLAEYSSLNYKVSFFTGSSGHHAIELSRLMLCSTDFNLFTNNLFKLLEISKRDRFKQDEVLYGRAGYLASLSHVLYKYSLYKSKKLLKCLEVDSFDLYNVIKPYIKTQLFQLHKSGIENENSLFPIKENYKHEHHLLYYDWHNKCYLGAAHGIAGILQIMLGVNNLYYKYNNSNLFLEVEKEYTLTANSIFLSISATTAYVMSEYSFCSGNIMASLESKSDKLVHWCHGAPGWITLCLQLSKIETAKNMAKVIWERGLLRKGLGLCHGIPGNAYCFLQLYKHTNDDLWLKAAIYFAKFAIEKIPELKDVPDRPNSLYEGIAGLAYFLTELEDPMNSSYMPGLEVAGT